MAAAGRLDPLTMSNLGFRLGLIVVALPAQVVAQPALVPVPVPAAAAPQQVSLHYLGEPGCPSQAEFVDEVTARVRRPVEWSKAGAAVQMVVIVRQGSAQASGTLEVVQQATAPTRREFTSSSCAEVGSALALVAALALDPNARTEQLPAHPPSSAVASAPPETAEAPAPAPPASSKPKPAANAGLAAPLQRPAPGRDYVVWLGPAAAVAAGYAPEPLVSAGLSLGARSLRPGFSPGLQLAALWGKTGTTGPEAAGGSFAWALGRFEACPVQLSLARRLTFEPCVAAELGQLSARGASVGITPVNAERWWFAAGATFSLHLSLGPWFARLGMLALVPATRDEFVFRDPNRSIHQAGAVLGGGSLGLGFQFGS